MEKISVIVPIYNTEKYLEKCVVSIQQQTYQNLEILLIDDGSTDRSGSICDELQKTDDRIIVIHKENGGAADARNVGIDHATGEIISFIDSDDFIDKYYLEKLYKALKENSADIAISAICRIDVEGNVLSVAAIRENASVISGKDVLYDAITVVSIAYISPTCKLYKREIFDSYHFEKGRIYEDEYILPLIFWDVERVAVIQEPLYFYVKRPGSVINSTVEYKNVKDRLGCAKFRCDFYKEKHAEELYFLALRVCYEVFFYNITTYSNLLSRSEIRNFKSILKNDVGELVANGCLGKKAKWKVTLLQMGIPVYNMALRTYNLFKKARHFLGKSLK